MKEKTIIIWLFIFALFLNTCEKKNDTDPLAGIESEALSEEDVNFLDDIESVELSADEVVLENGQTVDEYLQLNDPEFYNELNTKGAPSVHNPQVTMTVSLLIARMNAVAIKLTDRSKYVYPVGTDPNQPAQNGLAYSYGQKKYNVREAPPYPYCTEEVYGLDCAGLIYQLFHQAGNVQGLWTTAEVQRQPEYLKEKILQAFPELTDLEVVDKGQLAPSGIQIGDIIYWLGDDGKAKHIGMALKRSTGELYIAQSNGTRYVSADCIANHGPTRGPRFINLNNALTSDDFGDRYGVVRISDGSISGNIKCGVMIKVLGHYHSSWPDGERDYDGDNGGISVYERYPGSFSGNTYNASYSATAESGTTYTGTIIAVLNGDHDLIVSLNWSEQWTSSTCNGSKSCSVTNIPFAYEPYYGAKLFQIEGEESCDHISSVEDKQICAGGLSFSMNSYDCTWKSEVWIFFEEE